jgi:predicted LPLAT superfamily acyltransferase
MAFLSLRLGWGAARLLVAPIALYYLLAAPSARAASRRFLARALRREPSWAERFRHIHSFAHVVLDRLFLLAGREAGVRIEVAGLSALTEAMAASAARGVLLFGSHLGSFEALRAFGRNSPLPVRATMYRANAGAYTRLMERLDPALARDTIEIGTPDAVLRMQEALARGEMVGLLADRLPPGARRRVLTLPFLGAPAPFPTAPFLLAVRLGVPAVQFFGLRTGKRAYRIEFASLTLHPTSETVGTLAARYVAALEAACRAHPFNWFNFHDVWTDDAPDAAAPRAAAVADGVGRPEAG